MKTILHLAKDRGHNQFSWLDSFHSFSFGQYYNPGNMHFGALRVLNDDTVAPGMGFGRHPHNDMEIVSIPLGGTLEHEDSMGSRGLVAKGDVQIMSAGTGVEHSEFNHSQTEEVKFLQVWIFPNKTGLVPSYGQRNFDQLGQLNQWQTLVSPNDGEGVKINQNAWFSRSKLDKGKSLTYRLHTEGNGVYAFLLSGKVDIEGMELNTRDALGLWEIEKIDISVTTDAEILLIEVPMEF